MPNFQALFRSTLVVALLFAAACASQKQPSAPSAFLGNPEMYLNLTYEPTTKLFEFIPEPGRLGSCRRFEVLPVTLYIAGATERQLSDLADHTARELERALAGRTTLPGSETRPDAGPELCLLRTAVTNAPADTAFLRSRLLNPARYPASGPVMQTMVYGSAEQGLLAAFVDPQQPQHLPSRMEGTEQIRAAISMWADNLGRRLN